MNLSKYFTIVEMTYLPQWKRCAYEKDGLTSQVQANLVELCQKLDKLREHFKKPIRVHCAYRPQAYNSLVGGASRSYHKTGQAVDFSIPGLLCDQVRAEIIRHGFLDSLNIRMEDKPGSNWVHIDTGEVGKSGKRFFKP